MVKNTIFAEKTFADCSLLLHTKLRNSWKFSPSKVSHYTICLNILPHVKLDNSQPTSNHPVYFVYYSISWTHSGGWGFKVLLWLPHLRHLLWGDSFQSVGWKSRRLERFPAQTQSCSFSLQLWNASQNAGTWERNKSHTMKKVQVP